MILRNIKLKAISKEYLSPKSSKFSSDFLSFAYMNVMILVFKKKANLLILLWQSWLSKKFNDPKLSFLN